MILIAIHPDGMFDLDEIADSIAAGQYTTIEYVGTSKGNVTSVRHRLQGLLTDPINPLPYTSSDDLAR